MSLQTREGPLPIAKMSRPQKRRMYAVAQRALDGVGVPEREEAEYQRVCLHILRPATDEEIELSDMARFPTDGTAR